MKRNFIGVEIEPIFCDVIVSRWQEFTGQKAILIRSGKEVNYES